MVDTTALFNECMHIEIREQEERSGVPLNDWTVTGRRSREWPSKEDVTWWTTKGPAMVQAYSDWRKATQWPIWVTPDGRKAIELEYDVPWTTEHPQFKRLKGFIDRVFVNPADNELVVTDIKSGSFCPGDTQLARYAAGVQIEFDIKPKYGAYLMVRKDLAQMELIKLDQLKHDIDYLEEETRHINRGIDAGSFPTRPGPLCGTCTVKKHCPEGQGK